MRSENFDIDAASGHNDKKSNEGRELLSEMIRENNTPDESQGISMSVSSVFNEEDSDKRYAYVTFKDGERTAEGKIPACVIIDNKGFSEDEKKALETYMKDNLPKLKEMAAGINIIGALMK